MNATRWGVIPPKIPGLEFSEEDYFNPQEEDDGEEEEEEHPFFVKIDRVFDNLGLTPEIIPLKLRYFLVYLFMASPIFVIINLYFEGEFKMEDPEIVKKKYRVLEI